MSIRIGINGFGRIATSVIRATFEQEEGIEIAGINIRKAEYDQLAYLLKYDTIFGRFSKSVDVYGEGLVVDGKKIPVYSESDPANIPWGDCGAEYIVEGTGAFLTTELASAHIAAGAKKVVISAPAKGPGIPTFVMGVNNDKYTTDMDIVSNASCTTNCLAPMAKVLQEHFGIREGLMTTIHAATSKQGSVDGRNPKDWRIGRSVFGNLVPTTTGAAKAVGLVIPELQGRLTGIAFRVPTADGSVVDLNVYTERPTTYKEICEKMQEASETYLKGVMRVNHDPIVSGDIIQDRHTCIFDANMGVQLSKNYFKLLAWYDNEWGYSSKMLELIRHMYNVDHK